MKTMTTLLSAAFIAGTASLAMAQGGGTGGGGSDVNPDRMGKGADQNPSSPGVNPAAGNKDATTAGQAKTGPAAGSAKTGTTGTMKSAPVAGTKNDSSKPSQAPTGTTK
jgi:hypothetical protein